MSALTTLDRYRGCLLGLACGDAVGTTVEFSPPGTFEPVTDMVGGGPFDLEPGQWTDDTSLALCLAESLLERGGFDPVDQLQRYVRWWKEGHWSSTGRCFDIGMATRNALFRFQETGNPFCGSTDARSAGNGSIMRLAPVPMRFASQPVEAVRLAERLHPDVVADRARVAPRDAGMTDHGVIDAQVHDRVHPYHQALFREQAGGRVGLRTG